MSATDRRTVHRPALILLATVAAVAALALGWWQWERFSSASGTAQNLGYAMQWPLFAGFALFAYFRFVRLEQEADETEADAVRDDTAAVAGSDTADTSADRVGLFGRRRARPAHEPREIPAGILPQRPRAVRDEDPVLAEYNSHLARLYAEDVARDVERSAG